MTSSIQYDVAVPVPLFGKWLVLACSVLTIGMGVGVPISLSVMFLHWQETFQVSRVYTSIVHSTCIGILFGASAFTGYVTNRIGPRMTCLIGSLLASTGLFMSMFATSIEYLIASTGVLGGLGFSFLHIPVFPCVTSIFTKYRTLAISLCSNGIAFFSIIYRYLFFYLLNQYGWRGALAIIAGIVLNLSVTSMIITSVVEVKLTKSRDPDGEIQDNFCNEDGATNGSQFLINSTEKDERFGEINTSNMISTTEHYIEDRTKSEPEALLPPNTTTTPKLSKWRFMKDILFMMVVFHVGFCLATLFSFTMILMDYSSTRGFDESSGVSFLTVVFSMSIIGRAAAGFVDCLPKITSFAAQALFGIPGAVSAILLSFCTDRIAILCFLGLCGFSTGGIIAIYPKCALDVQSVDAQSYPIALGVVCTMEGLVNLLFPIVIGYSVDVTGSYTCILIVIGASMTLSTALLGFTTYYKRKQ